MRWESSIDFPQIWPWLPSHFYVQPNRYISSRKTNRPKFPCPARRFPNHWLTLIIANWYCSLPEANMGPIEIGGIELIPSVISWSLQLEPVCWFFQKNTEIYHQLVVPFFPTDIYISIYIYIYIRYIFLRYIIYKIYIYPSFGQKNPFPSEMFGGLFSSTSATRAQPE
jgi:hypothetical protein